MAISGIQSGVNLLISAVRPAPSAPTPAAPEGQPSSPVKNSPSFFALSVLSQVLEAEQSLLDGKDHSGDTQNLVGAAASAVASQQVADAYGRAQDIAVTAAKPVVSFTA